MEKLLKNGKDHFAISIETGKEAIKELDNEQLGNVLFAILDYSEHGIEPENLTDLELKYFNLFVSADAEEM